MPNLFSPKPVAIFMTILLLPISLWSQQIPFGFFRASTSGGTLLTAPGSLYTEGQCTAAGGTVVTGGGVTMCRFTAASCPGGWTQFQNWSTTTSGSETCNQGAMPARTYNCMGSSESFPGFPSTSETFNTGSHAFSNTAVETAQRAVLSLSEYEIDAGGACTDTFGSKIATSVGPTCAGVYDLWRINFDNTTGGRRVFNYAAYSFVAVNAVTTQIGCK